MTANEIVSTVWGALTGIVFLASAAQPFMPTTGVWVIVRKVIELASLDEDRIKSIMTGSTPTVAQAIEATAATVEAEAASNDANAAVATVKADLA